MLKELTPINSFEGYYTFNEKLLYNNYKTLESAFNSKFSNFQIAYSFKTNYTPYICKVLKYLGVTAEVVSEMELDLALKLGFDGPRIIYNGPFKSRSSLVNALKNSVTIHIDSIDELLIIEKLVNQYELNASIGIRVNFEIDSKTRSRFGIDYQGKHFSQSLLLISKNSRIHLKGIHCHLPFRDLDTFRSRSKNMIEICSSINTEIEYIDLGGGFLGPISKELEKTLNIESVSYEDYASEIYKVFNEEWKGDDFPKLIIEPGNALVANVFDFYCKVVSVKEIGKSNIATLTGSKFNITPTVKKAINLPIKVFPLGKVNKDNAEVKVYDFCGYTCIEDDFLYKNFEGFIQVGDVVKFSNVGSYSVVLKPPFILPNYPIVLFNSKADGYKILKEAEDFDYIFEKFNFFI